MSWSITAKGTPEEVIIALEEHSTKIEGQSKKEYDGALPHLVGLVKENFNKNGSPNILVEANGHGYFSGDEDVQRQCNVNIKSV